MKLNWSWLNQTFLSITLLTSTILLSQTRGVTVETASSEEFLNPSRFSQINHLSLDRDSNDAPSYLSVKKTQKHSAAPRESEEAHSQSSKMADDVIAAATETQHKNIDAENSEGGFISKKTAEIEFTFAILIIVVGLIVSERCQRSQEQQQEPESSS